MSLFPVQTAHYTKGQFGLGYLFEFRHFEFGECNIVNCDLLFGPLSCGEAETMMNVVLWWSAVPFRPRFMIHQR